MIMQTQRLKGRVVYKDCERQREKDHEGDSERQKLQTVSCVLTRSISTPSITFWRVGKHFWQRWDHSIHLLLLQTVKTVLRSVQRGLSLAAP